MKQILRINEVKQLTGLSRSTIYQYMAERRFPKSVSLGARSVGWLSTDVYDWINQKVISSVGGDL